MRAAGKLLTSNGPDGIRSRARQDVSLTFQCASALMIRSLDVRSGKSLRLV